MDFVILAQQIIQALTPLAPVLSGIATGVSTSMINKLGEDVYDEGKEQGKLLYQAMKVRVEEEKAVDSGKASTALQNFIEYPEDYDYAKIFRKKLEALLQADPAFAGSLDRLLHLSPALQQIILLGENGIAEGNEQSNTLGIGVQRMEGGKGAKFINNKQNIS